MIPSLSCDSLWRRARIGRLNHDKEQLLYSFHLDKAVQHDHPGSQDCCGSRDWRRNDWVAPFVPEDVARHFPADQVDPGIEDEGKIKMMKARSNNRAANRGYRLARADVRPGLKNLST